MLKSMTAYGRGIANSSLGRIIVEIQSVNRKFLDIHLQLPSALKRFEGDVRKWLSSEIVCGQVRVNVMARFYDLHPVVVTPNLTLIRDLKDVWQQIASELNVDFDQQFNLSLLAGQEGILLFDEDVEHDDDYRSLLHEAITSALTLFIEMRKTEGEVLRKDLCKRMELLVEAINKIELKVAGTPKKYIDKLSKRLEEFLPDSVENEERLLRELVIYAERVDVTEEITRFNSHLEQLKKMVIGSGTGKSIEFIIQELGREINTLGSKSPDIEVSHLVVEVKTELAKMKEQIQNVE